MLHFLQLKKKITTVGRSFRALQLEILLESSYPVMWKIAIFEWREEQERALQERASPGYGANNLVTWATQSGIPLYQHYS